jgi:D-alanine-D-alanine ligase
VFPVLHGPYGEDGTVQGLFELANLPYVGAGVLASAVGMDKAVMKVVFAARGLRVAPWMLVMRREWIADPADVVARVIDTLGLPVFVKPSNLGSSVGISKAKDVNGLREAIALAAGTTARSWSSRRTVRTHARSRSRCSRQRRRRGVGRGRDHPVA